MDSAKEIRKGEALDWQNLEGYVRAQLPDLKGNMSVGQFHGGHANLTYLLNFGTTELVLRRPPFGKIAPGSHDMKREYKVLSKLHQHYTPAPRAYLLCEDVSVIGAPFVVIERRKGVIIRTKMLECFQHIDKAEERVTDAIIRAQAELHMIDYKSVGLENLGNPEGFLERQIQGWSKRWSISQTEENHTMNKVLEWLKIDIPVPQAYSIIHNDIKPDNCQFQPDNPDKVTSIFDWDMCTIGDPLVDFATTLSYYPNDSKKLNIQLPISLVGDWPHKTHIVDLYQSCTGFNLDRLSWYESFSYWKGAVVLQQLYKRFVDGATKDERMSLFGAAAKAMGDVAMEIAEGS